MRARQQQHQMIKHNMSVLLQASAPKTTNQYSNTENNGNHQRYNNHHSTLNTSGTSPHNDLTGGGGGVNAMLDNVNMVVNPFLSTQPNTMNNTNNNNSKW
eukprot:UN07257